MGKTIALYAFCGPPSGALPIALLFASGNEGLAGLRQSGGPLILASYVVGVLPAAATGAYAAMAPYGRALRFIGGCALAGLLFSVVEAGIVYPGFAGREMSALGWAAGFAGLIGAVASLPCSLILRRWRRNLLHPERLADAFN